MAHISSCFVCLWTSALVMTSLRGSCSAGAGCWPRAVRLIKCWLVTPEVRGRDVDVPALKGRLVDGGHARKDEPLAHAGGGSSFGNMTNWPTYYALLLFGSGNKLAYCDDSRNHHVNKVARLALAGWLACWAASG
jgi:hypothetical protein